MGSLMLFSCTVPRAMVSIPDWLDSSRATRSEITTEPGAASDSMRAATLTPDPYTPSSSRTTSARCSPMRTGTGSPTRSMRWRNTDARAASTALENSVSEPSP